MADLPPPQDPEFDRYASMAWLVILTGLAAYLIALGGGDPRTGLRQWELRERARKHADERAAPSGPQGRPPARSDAPEGRVSEDIARPDGRAGKGI